MPATANNTVRNRRSSSADRRTGAAAVSSPITTANYRGPSGALRHLPINGEEVASPAPSASPPHRWGTAQPLRRLRRHLPIKWGRRSRSGDREALVVAHQAYRATYRELVQQCEEVARGLIARGVKKGDRVGIWSPNRYEWVVVQYATAAMGAILVNINPAYRTSELEYALNQSGTSFLILAAAFRQADYRAMLAEVKGKCPGLREALVLEDGWDALKRDASRVKASDLDELEHPRFSEFDFSSLRTGIMAGSPCPVEIMKKVQTVMHIPEMTIAYGMTETSPVSTQCTTDDPLERRVATVGRVHPHVEIKIVDPESSAVVPLGTPGELCSRGYMVMRGYWNNEEATRQAIDAARWMHTGDLATMDEGGYINIVGRIKDMIIRGGENIYPREVEEFLYGHPDLADVQVIGVPSEKYGEEVMAWVKLREGATSSGEELGAWCKGKIATYKIPRHWKFVDSFPMTVTGKIQKFKMREESVEELGLAKTAGVRTA